MNEQPLEVDATVLPQPSTVFTDKRDNKLSVNAKDMAREWKNMGAVDISPGPQARLAIVCRFLFFLLLLDVISLF